MGDAQQDPGPFGPVDAPDAGKGLPDLSVPPPLGARVRGVLLDPRATFARHHGAWGWLGPWLLVSLAGLLSGVIYLARVDVGAMLQRQNEAAFERMPAAQRRQADDPKVREVMETTQRVVAFFTKAGKVVGPPVGNLLGLLVAGALLFGVASRLGEGRPDLTRCFSVAAHVQLVNLVGIAAETLGALTGNEQPLTSPANLVDPFAHPLAYTALSRLDPVALLYYAVLAAALQTSLRVPPPRALAVAGATYVGSSLLSILLAAAGAALGKLGGGA